MCVCSIHLESFLTWGHGRDCRVVLLYVFPIYYSNNGFSIPYVLLYTFSEKKEAGKMGLKILYLLLILPVFSKISHQLLSL